MTPRDRGDTKILRVEIGQLRRYVSRGQPAILQLAPVERAQVNLLSSANAVASQ